MNWLLDVDPAPALLVTPPGAASLDEAHAAIELWEHYSRKTLDGAQRLTVEVLMATAADGRWAAATTGREMPRQNGKGDEIEVVELWGLTQRGEAILHTVHDAVLLASQAQQRMLGLIESHGDLRRLKKRSWKGTGQQMIEMRNGGIIWYRTRTGGGGRGVDMVDRLVVDEAQHATEEHLAAVAPTLLANENPQLNALGSAGIEGISGWWWLLRMRALAADPGACGYVGHTAEVIRLDEDGRLVQEPVDVYDRALWRAANPAIVAGRGNGMDFLEEQLLRLGPGPFAREHLGVWDPPPTTSGPQWSLFPKTDWTTAGVASFDPGPLRYALDADTNASGDEWFAVSCSDGTLVEDVTPQGAGPGASWVVPTLAAMASTVGRLLVAKDSRAWRLVDELEAAGVEVEPVTPADFAVASQQMLAALPDQVRHLNQPRMTKAAAAAVSRDVGDGAWKLSRRLSGADIAPVCAGAMARWAAVTAEPDYDVLDSVH